MPVTKDIAETYRGPGHVVRRLLDAGRREDRALAIVMAGCLLVFVAQSPWQARLAHFEPEGPLGVRLYWSGFFFIFLLPLGLYMIAALSHAVALAFGGRGTWYGARIALFWALLASSPLILLMGLVAAFVGPGLQLQIIGLAWLGVFLWFWIAGLNQAERAPG